MPHYGVQFHPESIITDCGEQLTRNWLNIVARCRESNDHITH
ncbi:glutamine amidotransferase-related protein [Porphyromonas loveana]